MTDSNQPEALDVAALLRQSLPRPRGMWVWALTLGILGLLIGGEVVVARQPALKDSIHAVTGLAAGILVTVAVISSTLVVRRQRAEQQAVSALEEMVQLRRWQDAAGLVRQLLDKPMRLPMARAQALMWLAMVLARFGRYGDVIAVEEYLLKNVPMDPGTAHGVRLGRAMAMLHEDHLVDVDRAIGELRRGPGGAQSAGLALIEMYRDVKTGHPAEAIEIFESRRDAIGQQLAHRAGDAWALAARAYDQCERSAEARQAYENATLLADEVELLRRYPELEKMRGRYRPANRPAEAW